MPKIASYYAEEPSRKWLVSIIVDYYAEEPFSVGQVDNY
jgi:hypothetical protein